MGAHLTTASTQNLTSGPTAIRTLFTLTTPLAPSSTIYSAFPLASSFGRAIAYTALFEGQLVFQHRQCLQSSNRLVITGCNFATLDSTSIVKASHSKC